MNTRQIILAVIAMAVTCVGPAPIASAADPIAKADSEQPGARLQVQELKRSDGNTLMLRYAVINESAPKVWVENYNAYLLDLAGKKKYGIVQQNAANCICSPRAATVKSNEQMNFWAKFAAPPDNVEKIGIVVPGFLPIDSVPISR